MKQSNMHYKNLELMNWARSKSEELCKKEIDKYQEVKNLMNWAMAKATTAERRG